MRLFVNGEAVEARPRSPFLVGFLREELGLTGTKEGCGVGVCGLCSVLADGRAVSSCLVPTATAEGWRIWTVEGLAALADGERPAAEATAPDPELARTVLAAFLDAEGFQCGICTPGQVVAATALLMEEPDPDDDAVRRAFSGNLCRCTGYGSIRLAVHLAATGWRRRRGPA